MPLYEYVCEKCGRVFEELVRGDEAVRCPQCQSERVERLISVPARPQSGAVPLPGACSTEGPT